jgi:diguanylate cyclase (GGDEF)-like protein
LLLYLLTKAAGSKKARMSIQSPDEPDERSEPETETSAAGTSLMAFWGTRAFLIDLAGGFYVLREQMTREIGPEFTADILYRAGFAGAAALMSFVAQENPSADGPQRLKAALALLSRSGYGDLRLDDSRPRSGEVRIRTENSAEGMLMRHRTGRQGYACDYLRGLLRGIVEALPPIPGYPLGTLDCVETTCVANDDSDCCFLAATPEHLAQNGYQQGGLSHSSVRETLLRLNRQLEDVLEAAKRDALTGLFNRAHFESVLRSKIEHAKRRTDTLAVAMIDLDGFKEVNDGMGHAMGDLALRQVGHLLAAQARETDLVARYGGDEFAWLMPGTSVDAALAVADRIRHLVQNLRLEMDLPISLSIGIASCPEDAVGMTELIDFADSAMYESKEAGGNQVCRYFPSEDDRKRTRKPRTRPASSPADPASFDETPIRLDLGD